MSKFIVAFGPNQSYYFGNRMRSIWQNVPQGLANMLRNDAQFSPDKLSWVSLGPNSSYFVKSSVAWGCGGISPAVESRVATLGGWKSVQWLQFTYDPNAYLILDVNGQLHSNGLSQDFHEAVLRYAFFGFKDICLGPQGGFALSTNNNMVTFAGMSNEFSKSWQGGEVLQVTTSAFDHFYFIEFKDGRSAHWCPRDWHAGIDELRNAVLAAPAPVQVATAVAPTVNAVTGPGSLTPAQMLEYKRHERSMAIINSIGGSADDPPYVPGPPNTTPASIQHNRHRLAMAMISRIGGDSSNDYRRHHHGYNW